MDKVATKRYTKARVRRILTYILVGAVDNSLPESIHVLGFSQKGQSHLKSVKKTVDILEGNLGICLHNKRIMFIN